MDSPHGGTIRLNKFIAMSGLTSRRKADDLITQGKIKVNGMVIEKLGTMINSLSDEIAVNGVKIKSLPKKVYYLLNKPKGYICANTTQYGDKLVTMLLPKGRLSTVGRLDKNTEGMLIVTNDGDFLNKVAHPSKNCEKEYEVQINRIIGKEQLEKLTKKI